MAGDDWGVLHKNARGRGDADGADYLTQLRDRVRRKIARLTRYDQDTEDLVQEAFLRLRVFEAGHAVQSAEGFLVRAARNLAIDNHRRVRRAPIADQSIDEMEIRDMGAGPDEVFEARERLQRLMAGLDALSPRSRTILLAMRLEGLTQAQVARQEGISVSAVEKHIARAMVFLIDWMEDP